MNIIMFNFVTRKMWIWELAVIVALVLFLSACSSSSQAAEKETTNQPQVATAAAKPTNTPEPTETPLPTSTPTPKPTDTPAPTRTATPDLQATAATREAEMMAEQLAGIKSEIEEIGYSTDIGELGWLQVEPVDIVVEDYMVTQYDPFGDNMTAKDFILKTDVTWESTSGLAGCGLIFRSERNYKQGAQYELAFLRLSGLPVWFLMYADDGEYVKDVTGTLTAGAIDQEQGSTNSYILVAEEGKFTLYINDLRIGSYYDYANSRLEGEFAFTGWQESGDTSCEFSNTWVWLLE